MIMTFVLFIYFSFIGWFDDDYFWLPPTDANDKHMIDTRKKIIQKKTHKNKDNSNGDDGTRFNLIFTHRISSNINIEQNIHQYRCSIGFERKEKRKKTVGDYQMMHRCNAF